MKVDDTKMYFMDKAIWSTSSNYYLKVMYSTYGKATKNDSISI